MSPGHRLTYLLVTPARNEEDFLELTIKSVVNQTIRPHRWVIVSDGSTDRTDEIVARYAAEHPWIELFRMPERTERHFAGKVGAFRAGYERMAGLPHDIIGSLDADLSFEPGYFEYLLEKFAADDRLGLAGTPFSEHGKTYDYRFSSVEHVSGACQLFRRQCYEDIGGYTPVKGGGIDVIAVLSARAKGWRTRTFTDMACEHHRPMGTGNDKSMFKANFKLGQRQYRLGFHPLWMTLRSFYQLTRKPYVIAGTGMLFGYFWALLSRAERPISRELVRFQQQDQMKRLKRMLGFGRGSTEAG
jgi:glycosyltransferase involved in cell wall biosynthesis